MRKRLVASNLLAALAALLVGYGLGAAGASQTVVALGVVATFVGIASVLAIRMLNELLLALSKVEEAVLRVAHGELEVRVGEAAPPFDGLAFRLDQVFEQMESSAGAVASSESARSDVA